MAQANGAAEESMSAFAWLGALAVGLTLGLLGSGGSILTVPLLVYVVHQPEKVAITGSLAIVAGAAIMWPTLPQTLAASLIP